MLQPSYVEVEGVRLHLVSGGRGRPVLFLHGLPEFWYAWKAQLAELAKTHRVIAVDLPGCNLSAPAPSHALGPIGDLVAGLLRQVAPGERVSIVGHDVGGAIAWDVAARHPELVDRLVAINAPPAAQLAREIVRSPAQREASAYFHRLRAPGVEVALRARGFEWLATRVFGTARDPDAFPPADRKAYLGAWSRPGAMEGLVAYYRAWDERTDAPPPVRAPTLVLWGEADPFLLPGCLDGIEAFGRDVRVERVPGATHWLAREEPALVNERLREFLGARPVTLDRVVHDVVQHRELWRRQPDYGCFLSSPDNARGLRLTPTIEPGRVSVRTRIEREHSGIAGIAHGGIPFTILDGLMGWLVMSHLGRVGVTRSAAITFRGPLRVGEEYEFEAVPDGPTVGDTVPLVARAWPVGRPGEVLAELRAVFHLTRRAQAEKLIGRPLDPHDEVLFPE